MQVVTSQKIYSFPRFCNSIKIYITTELELKKVNLLKVVMHNIQIDKESISFKFYSIVSHLGDVFFLILRDFNGNNFVTPSPFIFI